MTMNRDQAGDAWSDPAANGNGDWKPREYHLDVASMNRVLLLYDTEEEDLARCFVDFLRELELDVRTVSSAPDTTRTLQDKETENLNKADGIIFLVTPGAMRRGEPFPSPSVTDEMGQVREKFSKNPERVVYLVDRSVKVQAIDQKPYIRFDRGDIRTVVNALTRLLKNLKASGLLGSKVMPGNNPRKADLAKLSSTLHPLLGDVCVTISGQRDGAIGRPWLELHLQKERGLGQRELNFVVLDLQQEGLIRYERSPRFEYGGYVLTDLGFAFARHVLRSQSALSPSVATPLPAFKIV